MFAFNKHNFFFSFSLKPQTKNSNQKLLRVFVVVCVAFILKELIQNAEDAGASEVKFMYDETEYGVESLWSPDMAQHQGEAVKKAASPPLE